MLHFQVVIEGFKSFKEQTTFEFQPGLNVLGKEYLSIIFIQFFYFVFINFLQLDMMKLGRVICFMVICCLLYKWISFLCNSFFYSYISSSCLSYYSFSDSICTGWPSVAAGLPHKSCQTAPLLSCWGSCQVCFCGNCCWQ